LVLDMAGQTQTVDAIRLQNWGFVRTLNNWLGSISFWRDLMRNRPINICGRGSELQDCTNSFMMLRNDEFVTAFLFHLRNYSQHGGFPLTGSSTGGSWNEGTNGVNLFGRLHAQLRRNSLILRTRRARIKVA